MTLIVIVDDRVTNRTIYSRLALSIGEGVTVRAFGDPCEALEWLEDNRPDLIVTDHDMPRIDGGEFIARFRALPHSAAVPIMMITVNDQRMLRLRALESGASDFLTTPIDHYEFLSRARNLLKLSKSAEKDAETRTEAGKDAAAKPTAENAAVVRDEAEEEDSSETRKLLAQCGGGAYALHVVEIDEAGHRNFDPSAIAAALRRLLRGDDLLARMDRRRFVILQKNVLDSADANACARRLLDLRDEAAGGFLKVGTSLPRPDAGAPEKSAAACLREAAAHTRAGAEPTYSTDLWRFQPRINLRSGEVGGAQVLGGLDPAEADDPKALRAALACAAVLRNSRGSPLSFSLKLRLRRAEAAPLTLQIAPLLAETRIPPAWLDLRICAQEALAESRRAEEQARALKALGVGLTLDLGALAPGKLHGREDWLEPLRAFAKMWRPTIMFPCGDGHAAALARLLRRLAAGEGCAPLLIADGVASASLLTPLLRAGVGQAQGRCLGAPFAARDFNSLFAVGPNAEGSPNLTVRRA
jgi:CheY-like chemotaxis protein